MSLLDPNLEECRTSRPVSGRRGWIRLFFVLVAFALILDVLPGSLPFLNTPKNVLSSLLNRIGLWQGEWPLFAPNPVVDNGWVSADLFDSEGNQFTWNTPHWVQTNAWERFYKFRHLNYNNRIALLHNARAVHDLSDYLARTVSTDRKNKVVDLLAPPTEEGSVDDQKAPLPVREVKLFKIHKEMILSEGESFPSRDETIWTLRTEPLLKKGYSD